MAREKVRLKDLIVIVPGIMGSVLKYKDEVVWPPTDWSVGLRAFFDQSTWRECINLQSDHADQIMPVGLVQTASFFPSLGKNGGYGKLGKVIRELFHVTECDPIAQKPGNLFEFAYDWRRANSESAKILEELARSALTQWREYSGAKDAKLIVLAHSMGGLVARHFMEVLGGRDITRALVCFGTPFRGSVNAVRDLHLGICKLGVDLSSVVRSLESVYELLPIYPMIKDGTEYRRISEVTVEGIDSERARKGIQFLCNLGEASLSNASNSTQYPLLPLVGTNQPTLQSAVVVASKLVFSGQLPAGIDSVYDYGDGTVPRVSATPVEESDAHREFFLAEKHSCLQNSDFAWRCLPDWLVDLQGRGLSSVRGLQESAKAETVALTLGVEDAFVGEPVTFKVDILADIGDQRSTDLKASIYEADELIKTVSMNRTDINRFEGSAGLLPDNIYGLTVKAFRTGTEVGSVSDVILVSG